jgi:hypothetical protein
MVIFSLVDSKKGIIINEVNMLDVLLTYPNNPYHNVIKQYIILKIMVLLGIKSMNVIIFALILL